MVILSSKVQIGWYKFKYIFVCQNNGENGDADKRIEKMELKMEECMQYKKSEF